MTRNYRCRHWAALVIFLGFSGCGGGGQVSSGPPLFFSPGLYQINGVSSISPSSNFVVAGSLAPNGNNVSGIMHITFPPCFSSAADIPVTGTLTDTANLNLVLPGGQKLSFNLTHPGGHTSFVNGTYTLTAGGCAAADQGTAAGQVLDFNGTWKGTFVSSTGSAAQITMVLNQTGPDAHGFFSANGNATFTGGTCFAAGTIDPSTLIIGQASQLTLDTNSPGVPGTTVLNGDFAIGGFFAATFSGSYTSNQGACSENGTASMSRQ
jgi:hypothetical protein